MSKITTNQEDHYKEASDNYHSAFFYSGEYETWQLDIILKTLGLSENNRLADIGGGTGRFASLIYNKAKLRYPVTCIDPSPDMLSQAKELRGVDTICCNAREFGLRHDQTSYDRILLKEVVHHLSEEDLKTTFSSLFSMLSKDGKVIICTRPHEVEYPFFEAAHNVWRQNQPPKEYYVSLLEEIGFHVSLTVFDYPAKLNIDWWTNMVKNRFWSTFSEFNDNEIASGVNEIYQKYGKSGFVSFTEKLVLIVAEKD